MKINENTMKNFTSLICRCLVAVMSDSFATLWTVACQAPLSMRFSGQEYWSGLPFPSPQVQSQSEIEPRSLALHADS